METTRTDDEGLAPGDDKLIPEWSVDADDQIIVLGLAVLAAFLAIFGWNTLTGDDETITALDGSAEMVAGPIVAADNTDLVTGSALTNTTTTPADTEPEQAVDTTAAPTTLAPTTQAPTTTAAIDLSPGVAAAITGFTGASSAVDGTVATLTGFVGTAGDKTTAGENAAAVPGITSVDNQLVVLEADVLAALEANAVDGAAVEMDDTAATVRGEVPDDAARTTAVAAAAAVPGVSSVIDELTVAETAVVTELNDLFELEPIQFASNSAQILEGSFGTLDQAVAILADNAIAIDIQGYTDVRGPEVANLTLSQARADAVLAYLVENGVNGDNLQATGYGETTQFADGDSADALAANRRVRFELI